MLARPSGHFNSQNPEENVLIYPQYSEFVQGIKSSYGDKAVDNFEFIYLLSIDEEHFFLARKTGSLERGTFLGEMADSAVHKDMYSFVRGYEFIGVDSFRKAQPREMLMRLLLHFICMAGIGIIISAEDAENHSSMMTSRECYAVTAVRIWYFLRYVRLLLFSYR